MAAGAGDVDRGRRSATRSASSPTATCARAWSPPASPTTTPVSAVMSAPAYTVRARPARRRRAARDARPRRAPLPGRWRPRGEVLGVVEEIDLLAVETLSSFYLRRRDRARRDASHELRAAARGLRPAVLALHEARVARREHRGDLLGRARRADAPAGRARAVAAGEPPAAFAWLALGSQARREATPGSDVDSAIVWYGEVAEEAGPAVPARARRARSSRAWRRAGCAATSHGATASDVLFVRSLESWQRVARSWIERPDAGAGADPGLGARRQPAGVGDPQRHAGGRHVPRRAARPDAAAPAGALRALAPAADRLPARAGGRACGEHRGRLDLKRGGLLPVVDLARWAGMAAGVTSASTRERLRAAGAAGTLPGRRRAHARGRVRAVQRSCASSTRWASCARGSSPTTTRPGGTSATLTRSYLKEAFRAVASVQKRIAAELSLGVR